MIPDIYDNKKYTELHCILYNIDRTAHIEH